MGGGNPAQYTRDRAEAFHTNHPRFRTYAVGFDLGPSDATAEDLLINYIASLPALYFAGIPGGMNAACGGSV